jgi:tetratricopeptide (TPR) repeat protein
MGQENNLEPGPNDTGIGDDLGAGEPGADDSSTTSREVLPAVTKGMTPGQRLAARKAQKAVDKKDFKEELRKREEEKREKEQEDANRIFVRPKAEGGLPEEVEKAAGTFTHFMQRNRGVILGGIGLLVLGAAAVLLIQRFAFTGSAEQAQDLTRALELSAAQIDASDTDGTSDDGKPVFKTREDRAKKAIEAFEATIKRDPKSQSAGWAQAGLAAIKLELGKHDEALKLYETAYAQHKAETPVLAARALEGIAISLEAAGKTDEAVKRFEELKGFAGGSEKDLAEYHLGRLKLAKGDRDGAKALLKPLYDRLGERKEGVPQSRYLRGEVEIRLAEIDSSLVDKGAGGGGGEPSQFSQEELQRLIEQLRQQQGGGVPPGGGAP